MPPTRGRCRWRGDSDEGRGIRRLGLPRLRLRAARAARGRRNAGGVFEQRRACPMSRATASTSVSTRRPIRRPWCWTRTSTSLVNFSHPFERREGIAAMRRCSASPSSWRRRGAAIRTCAWSIRVRCRSTNRSPRAMNSTRARPCARRAMTATRARRSPPEQALLALPDAPNWQLRVRPTVVYGPFCGVWTNRVFSKPSWPVMSNIATCPAVSNRFTAKTCRVCCSAWCVGFDRASTTCPAPRA